MTDTINLSARAPIFVGATALFLLIFGFGTWSVNATLASAIISQGEVQVDRHRQVVQHLTGGVVAQILATEGDSVAPGQVLIALDPTLIRADLRVIEEQLFETQAQRARLEAERDFRAEISFPKHLFEAAMTLRDLDETLNSQTRLFDARQVAALQEREQLARRRSQIDLQIQGMAAQRIAAERQSELIDLELDVQQRLLGQGLIPQNRVLALQREQASLSGNVGEIIAAIAEAAGRQTDLSLQVLTLDTRRKEDTLIQLRDLHVVEAGLARQRRSLLSELDRLEIRAPVGGILHGMTVFAERAVIRPAEPLVHIVPQDRPLRIVTRLMPSNVDEVFVGQAVQVRFSAFNSAQPPEINAQIQSVSADALTDPGTGQHYYRIDIAPLEDEARLLSDLALVPGMPVEAFIRTADQSPLNYLLAPLNRFFSSSLRES